MEEHLEWLLIPVLLLLLALFPVQYWALHRWDKHRIRAYVTSRGGEVKSVTWQLFGTGWLAHENTRAYAVQYVDGDGISHRATCRTAWLGGVYFTDDLSDLRPRRKATLQECPPENFPAFDAGRMRQLEEENAALRAELERLKRGE